MDVMHVVIVIVEMNHDDSVVDSSGGYGEDSGVGSGVGGGDGLVLVEVVVVIVAVMTVVVVVLYRVILK